MLGPTHAAFRVALSIPPPLPPRPQLLVPLSASSLCADRAPKNLISDEKRDDGFKLTSPAEEDSEKY